MIRRPPIPRLRKKSLKMTLLHSSLTKMTWRRILRLLAKNFFMKCFIRKIPNFDWTIFGSAIVRYVKDLKVEIVEDAKRKKEEMAAKLA